jgi:SAM-dependent methyltransferase
VSAQSPAKVFDQAVSQRALDRADAPWVFCPVCESRCSEPPLYRYSAGQAANHFCPTTRDAERNRRLRECIYRLWNGNECSIRSCSGCGFAFADPFVGGDTEFYELLHEQRHYPTWRWDYDFANREAVTKFNGGKVLDIGAGAGMFLRQFDEYWETYAVEGSEATRRDLEADGVKVFRDLQAAIDEHAGTFQVVTLFQVLEHIADFEPLLKDIRQLLAPTGKLAITVPDGPAMVRQEKITGCPDMPPNHVNKWTPRSLELALKRGGFACNQPVYEPASWKNLQANLHMRLSTDATNPRTIAAQVYRLSSRPARIGGLALLSAGALIRMLPHATHLRAGGAFGIVAGKS